MEDIVLTGDNKVIINHSCVPTNMYSCQNERSFSIWGNSLG